MNHMRSIALQSLVPILLTAGLVACDEEATATGLVGAPDAPTNVDVEIMGNDVFVQWEVTDQTAIGYRVAVTSGGDMRRTRNTPGPASGDFDDFMGSNQPPREQNQESISVTFRDLEPGTWAAQVVAFNGDGDSPSVPVQFTISGS